jgi:hypothetical protein
VYFSSHYHRGGRPMFHTLDNFLIDWLYQPVANWVHEWFGINNFALARLCCYIPLVTCIASVVSLPRPPVYIGLTLLLSMFYYYAINPTENIVSIYASCGYRNPFRAREGGLRICILIPTLCFLGVWLPSPYWLDSLVDGSILIVLSLSRYFIACELLPPQKGRIEQYLEDTAIVSSPT